MSTDPRWRTMDVFRELDLDGHRGVRLSYCHERLHYDECGMENIPPWVWVLWHKPHNEDPTDVAHGSADTEAEAIEQAEAAARKRGWL